MLAKGYREFGVMLFPLLAALFVLSSPLRPATPNSREPYQVMAPS